MKNKNIELVNDTNKKQSLNIKSVKGNEKDTH